MKIFKHQGIIKNLTFYISYSSIINYNILFKDIYLQTLILIDLLNYK